MVPPHSETDGSSGRHSQGCACVTPQPQQATTGRTTYRSTHSAEHTGLRTDKLRLGRTAQMYSHVCPGTLKVMQIV